MDSKNFLPASDPALLSKQVSAALMACSDLMGTITRTLPEKQQALLGMVMSAGGKVGMELCVNQHGQTTVSLVAVEALGQRRPLAEVATIGQRPGPPN